MSGQPWLGPQVHEHIVGIQVSVLGVHVLGVEADQTGGDGDDLDVGDLGPGPVSVVGPGHDAQLSRPGEHIGVAQTQCLTNPKAGLGQQGEQEPVPQVLARLDDGQDAFPTASSAFGEGTVNFTGRTGIGLALVA